MSPAQRARDTAPGNQPNTREIAHRLINRHGADRSGGGGSARAAAAACDDLYRDLSRWVGPDGCHALFVRAYVQARIDHPALEQIQLRASAEPYLDGAAESIKANGDAATAAAVESMLVALLELLARLIGADMVARLVQGAAPWTGSDRPKPADTTEHVR
jgi:hypothetical protein